jgi:hypothetical protein
VFAWPHKFIASTSGKIQYYDLSSDPAENKDLAVVKSADARDLGLKLSQWVRTVPAQARQPLKLEGEALQRLKSLGYVQ